MYQLNELEQYIQKLYYYHDLIRDMSIENVAQHLGIKVVTGAPASYIRNNIILIESGTLAEEWQAFGHELAHYLQDSGDHRFLYIEYVKFLEYKAEHFMYHFCVPSFMLVQDDLPFCRTEAIHTIMKRYGVTKRFAQKRLEMYERKLIELHYY